MPANLRAYGVASRKSPAMHHKQPLDISQPNRATRGRPDVVGGQRWHVGNTGFRGSPQ